MSSFWDSKPKAVPDPPATNRGSAAWWQEEAIPQPQTQQHQLMQQGAQETGEYRPSSTVAAKLKKSAGNCPECDSPNYTTTGKQISILHGMVSVDRCYDCGYPVENSTRGMQSAGGNEPGHSDGHARQIPGAGGVTRNFHPEVIVDRAPGKRGPRTQ